MSDFLVGLLAISYVVWCLAYWVRKNTPRLEGIRYASERGERMERPERAVAHAPAAASGEGKMRPFVIYKGEPREVLKRNSLGDTVQCVLRPDTAGGCRPCVVVPRDQVLWLPK